MRLQLWSMTAVAGISATAALADPETPWDGHMMWGGGYGVFGGLMMLVFWGVIIALIVLAVHWLRDNSGTGGKRSADALDILRERLAKGEIDEEEYRRRKAALEE